MRYAEYLNIVHYVYVRMVTLVNHHRVAQNLNVQWIWIVKSINVVNRARVEIHVYKPILAV